MPLHASLAQRSTFPHHQYDHQEKDAKPISDDIQWVEALYSAPGRRGRLKARVFVMNSLDSGQKIVILTINIITLAIVIIIHHHHHQLNCFVTAVEMN